jgi:hypothetical protein
VDQASFAEALATKADAPVLSALEDDLKRQLAGVQAALQLKASATLLDEVRPVVPAAALR